MSSTISESPYYGAGSITREQFLFYETRTTARLMNEGLSDEEILKRICSILLLNRLRLDREQEKYL